MEYRRHWIGKLTDRQAPTDVCETPLLLRKLADHRRKRAVDVVLAAVAGVVTAPLQLLIAVAVRVHDRGPILHRATRLGLGTEPFTLYKFRTMRPGSDLVGPGITRAGDQRVTTLGRWLRRTKLDELPQLYNVLKGDMSIVGPRPEDPRYLTQYSPELRQIFSYKPGITSPATIEFRDEEALLDIADPEDTYLSDILPRKVAMDLEYARHATTRDDVKVLIRTLGAIFRPASSQARNSWTNVA